MKTKARIKREKENKKNRVEILDFHCGTCGKKENLLRDKKTSKIYCVECWNEKIWRENHKGEDISLDLPKSELFHSSSVIYTPINERFSDFGVKGGKIKEHSPEIKWLEKTVWNHGEKVECNFRGDSHAMLVSFLGKDYIFTQTGKIVFQIEGSRIVRYF